MIINRDINNKMFNIDISNDSLNEIEFLELEKIIRNIENQNNDWLSIKYKYIREDKIRIIQTAFNDDEYYEVEIVFNYNNNNNFKIYGFQTNNIEDIIEIFKYVLIDYKCPIDIKTQRINKKFIQQIIPKDIANKHKWRDLTSILNYAK